MMSDSLGGSGGYVQPLAMAEILHRADARLAGSRQMGAGVPAVFLSRMIVQLAVSGWSWRCRNDLRATAVPTPPALTLEMALS
jgi:hypothetical protein